MRRRYTVIAAISVTFLLLATTSQAQPADTIRAGDPVLDGIMPHFGTDTVDGFRIVDSERTPTNIQIRTIERFQEKSTDVILVTVKHVASNSTDTTINQTLLRTDDLSLIRQGVRAPQDSGVATYALGVISGWVVPPGEEWHKVSAHPGRRVFPDDGLSPWMLGLLPFKEDYEAAVPFFNMWRGEEVVQTLRVVGSEVLTNGDAEVECWKVKVNGQGPPGFDQYRWISKSSRRTLKGAYLKGENDPEYWGIARQWF